jgi:hypothetical protein
MSQEQEARGQEHEVRNQGPEAKSLEHEVRRQTRGHKTGEVRSGVRNTLTGAEKHDKYERGPGVREHSVWCQRTQCQVSGNTGVTEHKVREREWQNTVLGNETGKTKC